MSMFIIGVDADGCGDCLVCHYYTAHYYDAQGQSFFWAFWVYGHALVVHSFNINIISLCEKNKTITINGG